MDFMENLLLEDDDDDDFFDVAEDDDDDLFDVAFGELAQDDDDDLDFDAAESDEERRRRRRRRNLRFSRPRRLVKRTRRIPRLRGKGRSRAGSGFATASDINRRFQLINKNISGLGKSVKRVSAAQTKNVRLVNSKVNAVSSELKKTKGQIQQNAMLSLFLKSDPELETVTLTEVVKDATPVNYVATNPKYKKDDNMMLPLILMGGLGGDSGGDNTLLMALAFSGGFK